MEEPFLNSCRTLSKHSTWNNFRRSCLEPNIKALLTSVDGFVQKLTGPAHRTWTPSNCSVQPGGFHLKPQTSVVSCRTFTGFQQEHLDNSLDFIFQRFIHWLFYLLKVLWRTYWIQQMRKHGSDDKHSFANVLGGHKGRRTCSWGQFDLCIRRFSV